MEREISGKEACPCGSEKNYKSCCKKKRIKWTRSGNELIRSQNFGEEVGEIFNDVEQMFEELYGRKFQGNDYVFTMIPNFRNDSILRIMDTMRMSGISEEIIYAYFKTDGILPIKGINIDNIPDGYLMEFEEYFDDYQRAMDSDFDNEINIMQYVSIVNYSMETIVTEVHDSLLKCFTDFIHRHSNGKSITNFHMKTELEYCMFSALKTIKTLESIRVLYSEFVPESIYILGRSVFENYLYLCMINEEKEFFMTKMYPKLDSSLFTFLQYPGGRINYNKVENRMTGEIHNVKVQLSDLKNKLRDSRDKEIYDVFYHTACQFVHVDILTAESYFDCYDPYYELNPSLVASVIIYTLSLLLLKELCKNRYVNSQFKLDCKFLINNLLPKLSDCLKLINVDKEKKNRIVEVLIKRLQ